MTAMETIDMREATARRRDELVVQAAAEITTAESRHAVPMEVWP